MVLILICAPATGHSVGVVISLEQRSRTTEHFRAVADEIGLSLSFSDIPLLKAPATGPQTATEIHYRTGYVQLRSYYHDHHMSDPLALEILAFNEMRNEAKVVDYWRKNVRLSLRKEQFQKKGAGLAWTFASVPKSVRAILGEGGIGLKVSGYRRITFSGTSRWQGGVENTGSFRQSKFPSLDMKQQSQFTIKGNIGSKIYVTVDQDSKRESDLANRIQIRYTGDEDDVLQTIELGNTTLNLPNTKFVGYSQRIQGLFGVKATAKLGNLDLTVITSQEKGNTEKTRFTPGGTENVTYLRDYQYQSRTFYDVGRFGRRDSTGFREFTIGQDSIIDFRLFVQGSGQASSDRYANMYVDPTNPSEPAFKNDNASAYVKELVINEDYFLDPSEFWIELEDQLLPNEFLACWMKVRTPAGDSTVGSLDTDTLTLKSLKPRTWNSGSSTWEYEWKNVYYLGAKNLSYTDFEFDIYKGAPGNEEDAANEFVQDGMDYLQIFGLDVINDNGLATPDGKLDNSANLLDLNRGLVRFPDHAPFNPAQHIQYVPGAPLLAEKVPAIYTESSATELRQQSVYYFRIAMYSKRTATYSLKRINILDGSETVTLDGRKLTRGVDYNIDYEIGQITFLNDQALNPNADLTIDFEYSPFISAAKKTLFGMRAEYKPGTNFNIGSSFLYKGQKSTDRKPKLGQEQSKDMIGELDFEYSAQPAWMTAVANAMPFVETSAKSTLKLSGEIARSMPNPNSEGQVIIDDFEGAELSSEMGRLREYWTLSSPPDSLIWPNCTQANRCELDWYNPYLDEFLVTEIWDREYDPNRSIPRHKVLVLDMQPDSPESWAGIMEALSTGASDQSRSRVLEVRLGTYGTFPGRLHIDLGEISEDVNGDGKLNTEDIPRGSNITGNGVLDNDEDTGLDGLFSWQEYGYDADTLPDPAGDDWAYDANGSPHDYTRINGTEGNSKGDRTGIIPDTEDLNGNDDFETTNNHYSFTIDLAGSPYLVDSSQYGPTSGLHVGLEFRTYRIPLWSESNAPENQGQGDSTLIRFARLWLDNFVERNKVFIASMEVVENRWQAKELADEDTLGSEKSLRVEVINNEENLDYYSPPGVAGYYDQQADLREREQSLLLKFDNFEKGDTGWASKTLNSVEDYTGYRYLTMWVHGDPKIPPEEAIVSFIFRMGNSADAYYEYHVDLAQGWADGNQVYFDFNYLTPIKETGELHEDSAGVEERWSGPYKIHGNPSLTQIRYLAVGMTYKDGNPASLSGQIWVDELILRGVRRDQGTAMRVSASAVFGNLFDVSANSEYQTYSFRQLTASQAQSGKGSSLLNGSTKTSHDVSTRVFLERFFPASWKISLPVNLKYSKSVSVPKLMTGSDIVLTPELQEAETTTKISHRFSISEKIALPTKHWLAKMTVNAFSLSSSMSRDWTWSPRTISDNDAYSVGGNYSISFTKLLPIAPFAWTRYLLFPKRVWGTTLSLLPKSFKADGSIQRTKGTTINSQGTSTFSYSRRFSGGADWTLVPFKSLTGSYGFNTERDLYDPELLKFSFNPRDILFGRETKFTQSLRADYNVPFFTSLSPRMSYSVDYNENLGQYQNNTRKVAVSATLSTNAKLDLKHFLGRGSGGRKPKGAQPQTKEEIAAGKQETPDRDSTETAKPEKKRKDDGGFGFRPHAPLVWVLRQITSPLAPISANYRHKETRSAVGLVGRPTMQYRFGLSPHHGRMKGSTTSSVSDRDSENLGDEYGLTSSVDVFKLTNVKISYDYRSSATYTTTNTRQRSQIFPQLSTTLDKLDRIILLKSIAPIRWILGLSTASVNYNQSFKETEKLRESTGDSLASWTLETKSRTKDLGASLRMSQSLKNGMRISADYGWKLSHQVDEAFFPVSFRESRQIIQSISFSTNYSFRAPNGVRFPLLRKLRLNSTMALDFSVKYDTNRSESRPTSAEKYEPKQNNAGLTLRVRANYSFSSSMNGGFDMNWTDTKDKMTGRTNHTRQVNISIEFHF